VITVAEKEWLLYPLGLPGTAGRGPACLVVWEAGGETLPPTRLLGSQCVMLSPVYPPALKADYPIGWNLI
jgi:hypothetical protein